MSILSQGIYEIQCVLLNSETVLNDDTVRCLEVHPEYWLLQPAEQRFDVLQETQSGLVLESNGHIYHARKSVENGVVTVELKKTQCQETISLDVQPQIHCFASTT